jgi:hypothetical protein
VIAKRLLLVMASASLLSAIGCCKEPAAKLYAFCGALSDNECKQLVKQFPKPGLVVGCPGDTVTLYWEGTVGSINIGASMAKVTSPGTKQIQVNDSVTIVASPPAKSCVGNVAVSIEVLKGDRPYTMEARWNFTTGVIEAYIPEAFMSPSLRAIDITGDSLLDLQPGTILPCLATPVLNGQQVDEKYAFAMDRAAMTKAFTRPLRPGGHWQFTSNCLANKPSVEDDWANDATYLFNLTLRCEH